MAKTLELVFRNELAKEITISVANPKINLTAAQVQPVMADIVAKNIFTTKGGNLVQPVESRLRVSERNILS